MPRLRPLATLALSAALVAAPGLATAAPAPAAPRAAASATAGPDPAATRAEAERLVPSTPTPVQQRLHRAMDHPPATGPGQAVCGPTELDGWVAESTADWDAEDMPTLESLHAFELPIYDAILFGSETDPAYALRTDQQVLAQTMRKLRSFWDIKSDDIQLVALHGDMLLDTRRTARVYETVYGMSADGARRTAELLADFVGSKPHFEGGNHPMFTFNAFAYTAADDDEGLGASDRIVMGDGLLQAYRELGYGDVAPQAILAHEFAHHVQFEIGMDDGDTAESTRRTELHADAAAAYFLSHPRGMSMQIKRVTQFTRVFFDTGDCQLDTPGHHGTPNQRERAAQWAYEVQEATRPKSKILSSVEFTRLFEAALPGILAAGADRAA